MIILMDVDGKMFSDVNSGIDWRHFTKVIFWKSKLGLGRAEDGLTKVIHSIRLS